MTDTPCGTVVLSATHGEGSGAERVLEHLLASSSERPISCVLAPENSSVTRVARSLGYRVIPWHSRKNSLSENTRAFGAFLGVYGRTPLGHVVHAWHTRGFEWALALGKVWSIPSSGTLHDDPSHQQFGWMRQKIIRSAARHLDGVVAVSHALAKRCEQLHWKYQPEIIRNGLPDAPHSISEAAPLRVGFLASHSLWKGTALLPEIIAATQELPLTWSLFGQPSQETAAIISSLEKLPRIQSFGLRPVREIFSKIDLLLHLSLEFDPFPTVLLEAARAGIPAIAARIGGVEEIVINGTTGILFPPGDAAAAAAALKQVTIDCNLRRALSSAARARFEQNFRVEQMVANYQSFWNRLRSLRS